MQASRRFLHHLPTTDALDLHELQFASQYISDEVADTVAEAGLQEETEFLREADPQVRGSAQGTFFESMAIRQRRQGGSFSAKTLVGNYRLRNLDVCFNYKFMIQRPHNFG